MAASQSPTVLISLTVANGKGNAALAFYADAFGAEVLYRMDTPDGGVAHSEFKIGDSRIFLSEEYADYKAAGMPEGSLSSCLLCIETDDCDAAHRQALDAGASPIYPPTDEFWGVRTAVISDPFGYRWSLGQLIEKLTPEEVSKRAAELFGNGPD